jgi:predicted transcriptional regulator
MKFINLNNPICCNDVIKCVFDLSELDLKVYKKLKKKGESRVNAIAKDLKRERSTVYRSLQKLTCCELCSKTTKTIKNGGYYHVYICKDSKQTRESIENCIDNWYKKMKNTIKELD